MFLSHICVPALYFILQPVQQKQKRCVMSRLRSACSPLRTKWKNFSLEVKKHCKHKPCSDDYCFAWGRYVSFSFYCHSGRNFPLASHGFKQETKVILAIRNVLFEWIPKTAFIFEKHNFQECIPKAVYDTVFMASHGVFYYESTMLWNIYICFRQQINKLRVFF